MNSTLKDIHWLMAYLYLALNNVGADAEMIPDYMTLQERYGCVAMDTDKATEIKGKGIGGKT